MHLSWITVLPPRLEVCCFIHAEEYNVIRTQGFRSTYSDWNSSVCKLGNTGAPRGVHTELDVRSL